MKKILRWALFVPCAFAASFIAATLFQLINEIDVGFVRPGSPHTISITSIIIKVFSGVIAAAFYFIAGLNIAPEDRRKLASLILFVAYMIFEAFVIVSLVMVIAVKGWSYEVVTAFVSNGCGIAASIYFLYIENNERDNHV